MNSSIFKRRLSNENITLHKSNEVLQSFMSTTSRTSSMTHVTSCQQQQQPQSPPVLVAATSFKPNEDQAKQENNYEQEENIQRMSSISSSDSTTSSLTSSSSDEAADKEIEAIVLPVVTQQAAEILETKKLLQNVDLSELLDLQQQLPEKNDKIPHLHHGHHNPKENWPNPPSIVSTGLVSATASHSKQQYNDQLLVELLQTIRTQHAENEKFRIHQQNQINTLKLHFDASIQRLNTHQLHDTVDDQVIGKLEKLVKDELKQIVQPQLNKAVEPFKEQIPKEIAEKLHTIENVLKENINKMFKSKTFMDTITQSLSQSLQSTIVNTYRDTFQKIIVPSFEKSCQNMYQQINQIFKKGNCSFVNIWNIAAQFRTEEHQSVVRS